MKFKYAKYYRLIYAQLEFSINKFCCSYILPYIQFFLISHSHEDCPLIDKKLNGREIPKHHVDDKEEEGSSPVVEIERMMWLSIFHILWQQDCHVVSWISCTIVHPANITFS